MADYGALTPPDVDDGGKLQNSSFMAELGRRINAGNWDAMLNSYTSGNIDDRRGDPKEFPGWGALWDDMKRNNYIARWMRNGPYAGPGYDPQPWSNRDHTDQMATALGADQIPVVTYGTTHPLKRYNPDYNSESPRLPWNRP